MRTRRTRRDTRDERGGRPRRSRGQWEPAAYWLLYVVAFLAVLLHWRAGNVGLAVLCAVAVPVSVTFITHAHRRGAA